jgi:hypothetical protein
MLDKTLTPAQDTAAARVQRLVHAHQCANERSA